MAASAYEVGKNEGEMDQDLKQYLEAMETRLSDRIDGVAQYAEQKFTGIQSDITGIKSDITGIKSDITGIQSDITGIQSDITGIKSDITGIQSDITGTKSDITGIKSDIQGVEDRTAALIAAEVGSLHSDIKRSEERLGARLDSIDSRLKLQAGLIQSGARAMARFSEYAETSEERWVALVGRVEKLERKLESNGHRES